MGVVVVHLHDDRLAGLHQRAGDFVANKRSAAGGAQFRGAGRMLTELAKQTGKTIITNTTTSGDVDLLRKRGARRLVTTTRGLDSAAGEAPVERTVTRYDALGRQIETVDAEGKSGATRMLEDGALDGVAGQREAAQLAVVEAVGPAQGLEALAHLGVFRLGEARLSD